MHCEYLWNFVYKVCGKIIGTIVIHESSRYAVTEKETEYVWSGVFAFFRPLACGSVLPPHTREVVGAVAIPLAFCYRVGIEAVCYGAVYEQGGFLSAIVLYEFRMDDQLEDACEAAHLGPEDVVRRVPVTY